MAFQVMTKREMARARRTPKAAVSAKDMRAYAKSHGLKWVGGREFIARPNRQDMLEAKAFDIVARTLDEIESKLKWEARIQFYAA